MGFYGNITNAASTNFIFDITYPNRKSMDDSASSDGVSIGRYVRVEYAEDFNTQGLISVREKDGIWYWVSNELENGENVLKKLELVENSKDSSPTDNYVKEGQIVLIAPFDNNYGVIALSDEEGDNNIIVKDTETNYEINYQIDFKEYGASYDGTAWVKQFKNDQMVYTLVAELNTVVPTFEITPVAPTDNPKYPHFGPESTNLNYDLHIQPSWGLRIADIDNAKGMSSDIGDLWNSKICKIAGVNYDDDDSYITFNLYKKDLDSITDGTTSNWTISPYSEPKTTYTIEKIIDTNSDSLQLSVQIKPQNENTSPEDEYLTKFKNGNDFIIINQKYTGGIYYNAAGFEPDKRSRVDNPTNIVTLIDECSGKKYLNPATGEVDLELPDTKGMVINLPSIGNAVSDTYDLLYGVNRDNDPESLAGKLNELNFSNLQENQLLLTNRYIRDNDDNEHVKFISVTDNISSSDSDTFNFIHNIVYEKVEGLNNNLYKPYTYYINAGTEDSPEYKLATQPFNENKIYYSPKGKLDIKFDLHLKNGEGENSLIQYSDDEQSKNSAGKGAVAFGYKTTASGEYSHTEGSDTLAYDKGSHAEGVKTLANGQGAHAEGYGTEARGIGAHAEGNEAIVCNLYAHAEGSHTIASGYASHAEGNHTIASGDNQHVQGKYNVEDKENKYAHIVGGGDGPKESQRRNIHTIDWNGNAEFAGAVKSNGFNSSGDIKLQGALIESNNKYFIDSEGNSCFTTTTSNYVILNSSTQGSTKQFKLSINDEGELSVNEL